MPGKPLDLIGQKYGNLIVLNRNYTYKEEHNLKDKTAIYWDCQCSCGALYTTSTKNLRSGKATSCKRCAYDKRNNRLYEDIIGKRYNRLIVLERDYSYKTKSRNSYWKCLCDCGNITIASRKSLLSGDCQSCGCYHCDLSRQLKKKDLKGNRYGELTVLEEDTSYRIINNISDPRIYWKCQCSCGNVKTFSSHQLQKHEVFSCGCKLIKSKGEARIQEILESNNISFEVQYNDERMVLRSGARPRFDFAFKKNNKIVFLLEYHGEQHYSYNKGCSSWNNEENFIKTQDRDNQKIAICERLNIPLEIISYKEYSKLEQLITKLLVKYHIKEI